MRIVMVLCLMLATAIAGATWLIVPQFLARPTETVQQPKAAPAVRVLVAATDLPAGTIVKAEHLRWQSWPEQGIADGFIVEGKTPDAMKNVVTSAVRRGFTAGEPVTLTRLVQKGEAGFLAAALSEGMRAVAVKVDAVSGAAGFILPGDRVDVMLTSQLERGTGNQRETKSYAEIVLSDVRVLAIDQNMNDLGNDKTPAKIATTATLEVSLHDAQVIGVANQLGRLTLVLAGLARPEMPPPPKGRGFVEEVDVSRFLRAMKKGAVEDDASGAAQSALSQILVWRGTQASAVQLR